jgi:hypothetical protein
MFSVVHDLFSDQHLDNNRSQYLQLVLPVVIMRAIYQSLKRVPEAVDGLSTRIVSRSQTNVQKDPSVRTNNLLTSRGSKKVFGTVQSRFLANYRFIIKSRSAYFNYLN